LDKTPNELTQAVLNELASLPRLDTPSVRAIRKRYSRLLRQEPGKFVYNFVLSLLEAESWPTRVIAWEVLATHPGAVEFLNDRAVEKMANGLDEWGSIDLFGVTVLGQAWREGLVSDEKIHSWAKSPDRWRRRLALVATVPLNSKARGGTGDPIRTLQVCRMLLDDPDDMVVKALSWALRELAKQQPTAVDEFIELEKDRIAALVKREVRNKLRTGKKT
jgi:3-methyladenine DNA glycosylase AlkD